MAGIHLETKRPIEGEDLIQFGRHLVQQGYTVVCTEAFPYNTVSKPDAEEGFVWWQAGAEKLLQDNPEWTGMGRLVWDTSRALDLLLQQDGVDSDRVVVMGHSLGGKMAFYAGSLDDRFAATVSSDFGIGFAFTNWDAPWYLGERIHEPDFPLAHHQLLALHAPRPFLLIGGEADRPASWQYLNEAKRVYDLYGASAALGFFDHASGHRPTEESLRIAYGWLSEQFGLKQRPWDP
jgi:predicted esterase